MQAVTGLSLTLLAQYAPDIRAAFTINQLAKRAQKPYANVHATVQRLLHERILSKETIGHSHRCALNLANEQTGVLLALLHARRSGDVAQDDGCDMVWRVEGKLLLVAEKRPVIDGEWIRPEDLLRDTPRFTTLGAGTLVHGSGTYARLLHAWGVRR